MSKGKKNELKQIEETQNYFNDIWLLILLELIFYEPPKENKIINIYMGDEK